MTRGTYWVAWSAMTFVTTVGLGWSMTTGGRREIYLPGETTAGHYQIEQSCETCHTPLGGVTNEPCLRCHANQLSAVDDSHPKAKFTDPRNADLLTRIDALSCVSCHTEHNPRITRAMGVTLPADYCRRCHSEIGTERPTHASFAFSTCATAGCHRYHDNTALYEDFLVAHADEPPTRPTARVTARSPAAVLRGRDRAPAPPLTAAAHDAPPSARPSPGLVAEWAATSHARGGVNCTGCHLTGAESARRWTDTPGATECAACHDAEVSGFFRGRHGMRLAAGLTPMTPGSARLPMNPDAHSRTLSCATCHSAHRFDTHAAATEACMTCHADKHTTAYAASPHAALWTREREGVGAAGTGVSCATCHLPRLQQGGDDTRIVSVQHNQSDNLRPSERMARTVCMNCHGLSFSLDALADAALVAANFKGRPARHVESIDMAVSRAKAPSK